jgi:hypothetical protein
MFKQPGEGTTMFKLGEIVEDKATGTKGMLTHFTVQSDGSEWYNFQPKLLNKDTGQPVKGIWLTGDRVVGGTEIPRPELPIEVLGSVATDNGTKFSGTCISIILHINGCVHLNIQPKGLTKDGNPIEYRDFDVRRCTGKMIKPVKERELEESRKAKPSPEGCSRFSPGRTR